MRGVERERFERAWSVFVSVFFAALSPRSRALYRTVIMKRALPALPPVVTTGDIVRWHRQELVGRYSVNYANQCLVLLRVVIRRAADVTGDVEALGVVAQVRPVARPVRTPRCPPDDALVLAIGLCRSPAERAFVALAGLAGLRCGEVMGLRPEDYDRDTHVLSVTRQRRSPVRKNRRDHFVNVDSAQLRADLCWTLEHREEIRSRPGWHRGRSESFLFPWAHKRVEGLLQRLHEGLGPRYLPRGVGWHAFRHWGATSLAKEGASVAEIQAWLGVAESAIAATYIAMVRGNTSGAVGKLDARNRRIVRALRAPRAAVKVVRERDEQTGHGPDREA